MREKKKKRWRENRGREKKEKSRYCKPFLQSMLCSASPYLPPHTTTFNKYLNKTET